MCELDKVGDKSRHHSRYMPFTRGLLYCITCSVVGKKYVVLWVRNTLCVDHMLNEIVIALPSIPDMVLTCQMLVVELCSTLSAKGATKGSI